MTLLALLRHAPTAANREHRLQGRSDPPLDTPGRDAVAAWWLPPWARALAWRTSPLRRCRETALLLGIAAVPEPRLIEMSWGAWEGRTLAELRAEVAGFAAAEAQGIDLAPPGGETPRQVQQRLMPLFREMAAFSHDFGGLTHKGVLRATYALATGWDMRGPPPARLAADALQLFRLEPGGRPRVEQLNIGLQSP